MKETTKKKLGIVASACIIVGYTCYAIGYVLTLKKQIKDLRNVSSPATK